MAAIAKNNAFGAGSPSWNLSFPDGNLTAIEILAYLPHWLKSVDVINRFVNHGGRSVTITYLLKKLRVMPSSKYEPNSTTVMMHYAMRRAGYKDWTIGTRHEFQNDREYDENSVYVGDFRPPRLTHPKGASTKQRAKKEDLVRNWAADPIPFKDLALHVREHPSGDDALDLTRCVDYALKHPKEQWLFPNDFRKLVKHIGGPLPVTHSHLDSQLFARYDDLFKAHGPERIPAKYNKKPKAKTEVDSDSDADSETETETETESKPTSKQTSRKENNRSSEYTKPIKKVMCQARHSVLANTTSPTFGKRALDEVDGSHDDSGGKRRSSRYVKKAPVYVERDEDATDVDTLNADYITPRKKCKLSRILPTPKDDESDFITKEEPDSDDDVLPAIKEVDSDFSILNTARGKRLTFRKGSQIIQEQPSAAIMEQFRAAVAFAKPAHKTFKKHSPGMMVAARAYEHRNPVFVSPPVLSANRMIIDPYTVYLYAQDGCRNEDELWASALSTYRFGGPRRHAPFRELHRLTEPMVWDTSDWAENIRWAKEQYREFGVETWTEYDDHLDYITSWRMQTMWVSEEVVRAGM